MCLSTPASQHPLDRVLGESEGLWDWGIGYWGEDGIPTLAEHFKGELHWFPRQVFGTLSSFKVEMILQKLDMDDMLIEVVFLVIFRCFGFHSQVDIIVCTPGRLVDHINMTPGFDLTNLRFLVRNSSLNIAKSTLFYCYFELHILFESVTCLLPTQKNGWI